jgi:hypothetical protein
VGTIASISFAADRTALIRHGLRALRDSLPNNTELTIENASVGVWHLSWPAQPGPAAKPCVAGGAAKAADPLPSSAGLVSADEPFTILEGEDLAPFLENLDEGMYTSPTEQPIPPAV